MKMFMRGSDTGKGFDRSRGRYYAQIFEQTD